MNFSTASKVSEVISQMKLIEVPRAKNRTLIDGLFNGLPPYTEQEAKENNIFVNCNFKEGTNALHAARAQYENAFLKPGNFFKVTLDDAPPDKQSDWSNIITREINKAMKKNRPYIHTQRNKFAEVVLHGVGTQMWEDDENPIPYFVGMQDILIPTGVDVSLENLQFFAVRRRMRPGALYRKTFALGDDVDPGWKLPSIKKLLDNTKDLNLQPDPTMNWYNQPEQMAEIYKQNVGYYDSDKAPEIVMWDFYFIEDGMDKRRERGWYRKIILDQDCTAGRIDTDKSDPIQFIYDSETPISVDLDEFVHFQFGDGNNVPPFKYHSIRSLGWLLFDVIQLMNRLRCQFTQHVFEAMLTLFRINDPADRAKVSKILLHDKAVIPDGVNIVPASERFQLNPDLVNNLAANMKQLITESSASYTQAIDNGTSKERTKFEVEAIMSQISSLMSTLLNLAYIQEFFAYQEICRRFTKANTTNFMVKKFIAACLEQGVPAAYINADRWTIAVEQVLGGGNKMLEIAQARELRGMRPTLDPEAQREVDRIYINALTDNPKLADFLVPEGQEITDAIHDAELAFGTLMQGVPMSIKEGLNHHEQITTLLKLMGLRIKAIQDSGGVGTPQDVAGFNNVAKYIEQHIAIVSQDPDERAQVKEYNDNLSNFMNFVRAFDQRQKAEQEKAMQAQNAPTRKITETISYKDVPEDVKRQIEQQAGLSPSTMGGADPAQAADLQAQQAKLQMDQQSQQTKMQMDQQAHVQNMTLTQQEFEADQARKDAEAQNDIARKNLVAEANAKAAAANGSKKKSEPATAPGS